MKRRLAVIAASAALSTILSTGVAAAAPVDAHQTPTTVVHTRTVVHEDDDDTGLWGLAGLLGLVGLAGLAKTRKRSTATGTTRVQADTTPRGSTSPQGD